MGRKRKVESNLPKGVDRHGNQFRLRIKLEGKWTFKFLKAKTIGECWAEVERINSVGVYENTINYGIDRYLGWLKSLADNDDRKWSQATYRTELPRIQQVRENYGDAFFDQVSRNHLYEWRDLHHKERVLRRFRTMWNMWLQWELTTHAPFVGFKWTADKARSRYISDDEFDLICRVCWDKQLTNPMALRVWAVLILTYLTGRRVSNIIELQLSAIKPDGIYFTETKTGLKTIVTMSSDLAEAIALIKKTLRRDKNITSTQLITKTNGRPLNHHDFSQAVLRMRRHFRDAGIADFQPRDLRAKYGTDHISGQANLRHTNPRTFNKHYYRKPMKITTIR